MRILLVTPYYIPAWGFGGPVKVVADIAQELHRRGHTVTVATTDALDAKHRIEKKQDTIDGIPVWYFPNVSTTAAFKWNIYLPRGFSSWLRQHIHEFDVIHCHDFYTGLNYSVSRIANSANVPYLIHPHGALIPTRVSARFTLLKRIWLRLFRNVLDHAATILASTEVERQEILRNQGVSADRVIVVPNGLSVSEVRGHRSMPPAHDHTGILPREKNIVYFGRIQYIKGVDISLRALALVKQGSWSYTIIGRDDGQQSGLEALAQELGIAERVHFVGPKFGPELESVLATSDIFLFNTRSESFPIAVLNACAAGVPVVASEECRVMEIASWGAGVLLPENTPQATAEVLEKLLPDTERLVAMSQAGQRLVTELFSLDTVINQLLAVYQRVSSRAVKRDTLQS